jgi:Ser/Thr protein kinase RdoA (MazF antagonist)
MADRLPSRIEVAELLRSGYGLELHGAPSLLEGGEDNLNVKVVTDRGTFVLRRYDLWLHGRARTELQFVDALADAGFPTPAPVRRTSRALLGTWEGRPIALFPFVPGRTQRTYDVRLAATIGSLLGKLHVLTGQLDLKLRRENHVAELGRVLEGRPRRKLAATGRWLKTVATFLEQQGATLRRAWRELPKGALHHDLHRKNLLIDGRTSAVTVLDFGEACWAPYAIDLARSFHSIAAEAPGRRLPASLRDALLEAYQKQRRLSAAELDSLPVIFDLMNLIDAARFLSSPPPEIKSTEECHSLSTYHANRSDKSV